MTVQELIEELKKLDGNTIILKHETDVWGEYIGTYPTTGLHINKLTDGVTLYLECKSR